MSTVFSSMSDPILDIYIVGEEKGVVIDLTEESDNDTEKDIRHVTETENNRTHVSETDLDMVDRTHVSETDIQSPNSPKSSISDVDRLSEKSDSTNYSGKLKNLFILKCLFKTMDLANLYSGLIA